ncbi:MAG: Lrp/AsnC family transcriptional regulator [Pseudomonadota bacterium]
MKNFASTTETTLDDFDRAILRIVQSDNQRSHASIGEEVDLSASAVRRRLARLRKVGVITRDVSIVEAAKLGETLVLTVSFREESPEIYTAFELQMQALPEVRQCYHIAGDSDYMLIVHVPSLEFYENWAKEQFMNNEAVRRYDTIVVWSCKKFDTAVPV